MPHPFSPLRALSRGFSNNAWLALFTLLIALGAASGLAMAWHNKPPAPSPGTGTGARGIAAPSTAGACGQFAVHFQSGASLRDIGRLLRNLDAAIVFGPDENGAYRLRVEPKNLEGIQRALDGSSLVLSSELQAGCE